MDIQLKYAINVLTNLHPPKLREVTVNVGFNYSLPSLVFHDLHSTPELWTKLEEALMLFPQPTLLLSPLHQPINNCQYHSWTPIVDT